MRSRARSYALWTDAVEHWLRAASATASAWSEIVALAPTGAPCRSGAGWWTDAWKSAMTDWLAAAESDTLHGHLPGHPPGAELNAALTVAAEHLVNSQAEWARAWTDARADLEQRAKRER